ncbi:MAG: hypothetical protein FWE67_15125 [Planctomycetaceae bacterium]|nr:hypothetical protein [Planctomycetaceae bacterium]
MHGGKVNLEAKGACQQSMTSGDSEMLCKDDLIGAKIENCSIPNTSTSKTCTKVAALISGEFSGISAGGRKPLLETLVALTDGFPAPYLNTNITDESSHVNVEVSGEVSPEFSLPEKPFEPDKEDKEEIHFVVKDEFGDPVTGERFRLTLPDGRAFDGVLDDKGKIDVEHICGGDGEKCILTFPQLESQPVYRRNFGKECYEITVNLARDEVWYAAAAAGLIYERRDEPICGLKLLKSGDLGELRLPALTIQYLTQDDSKTGLGAGLYQYDQDGKEKLILAFAGSVELGLNIEAFNDWWTNNYQQAKGKPASQYLLAMRIADALKKVLKDTQDIMITGHSLGGGLASAAYCVSGFKTYTFNAAGLHENTIRNGNIQDGKPYTYHGSIERYKGAEESGKVTTFYVDYDIGSFIQDNEKSFPVAIGRRELRFFETPQRTRDGLIELLSPTIKELTEPRNWFLSDERTLNAARKEWNKIKEDGDVKIMVECHKMPAVYTALGMRNFAQKETL